jgi:hypothetical protein
MNLLATMPDDLSVRRWTSASFERALCLAFHDIGSEAELIGEPPNTLRVIFYLITCQCRRRCRRGEREEKIREELN